MIHLKHIEPYKSARKRVADDLRHMRKNYPNIAKMVFRAQQKAKKELVDHFWNSV